MTHKKDWVYWKIDGRTSSVKITVKYDKSMHRKDQDFYFEYWDEAYKFYLDHSAYFAEDGLKNTYLFQRRFDRTWFVDEAHRAKIYEQP